MQRPTSITVICVLGFIGAAMTLFVVPAVLANGSMFPGWYLPYLLFSMVVGLVMMVGLWKMKKWGALGYAGFTALNQVVLILAGMWTPMALILPGIVAGIALSNLPKMT